jgi:hypothetical protein
MGAGYFNEIYEKEMTKETKKKQNKEQKPKEAKKEIGRGEEEH